MSDSPTLVSKTRQLIEQHAPFSLSPELLGALEAERLEAAGFEYTQDFKDKCYGLSLALGNTLAIIEKLERRAHEKADE